MDRQLSGILLPLMPSLDQAQLQGPLGPALVATLSSDLTLRQALLQGMCLFTVAAARADTTGSTGTAGTVGNVGKADTAGIAGTLSQDGKAAVILQHPDTLDSPSLSEMEAQASAVATALQASIVRAVEQVRGSLVVSVHNTA